MARLARVENGNFGDHKQIANNLYELRFFFGSGFRVYYTFRNGQLVLLIKGGDKSTQTKDIDKAKQLLKELESKMKISNFDIAEHLETDEDIREFLIEVANEGDEGDLIHALNIAARAKGMSTVAEQAGVTRASLYKSLAKGSNPKFSTINKIISSFGCKLAVV